MFQQFNDEVAQVAGSDIVNHYNIHIHVSPNQGEKDRETKIQLIRLLLRKAELAGLRRMLENISYRLYGSSYFKSLTLDQLITLHAIADEVLEVLYRSRGHYAAPTRRVGPSATL